MIRPDIKTYREDRRQHWINPEKHRKHFLGRTSPNLNLPGEAPLANISRNDSLLELELVMPGYEKEEIQVNIENDIMTVLASKETIEESNSALILQEFDIDRMERRFLLAEGISKEKISAKYNQGILRITFTDVPPEEEKLKTIIEVV